MFLKLSLILEDREVAILVLQLLAQEPPIVVSCQFTDLFKGKNVPKVSGLKNSVARIMEI